MESGISNSSTISTSNFSENDESLQENDHLK